ncbi:hypothetical protein HPB48_025322 [Haemaphysalis longicornis]|uniref:Homeobox domain-containing protein n=1 Tax=Haemaphysalis longicornis TaxID=44386 RepID=A0A9J6HA51_HAELO|nr:hypothetical protein HPB48_025322 [Haemaphysalis longicornis]
MSSQQVAAVLFSSVICSFSSSSALLQREFVCCRYSVNSLSLSLFPPHPTPPPLFRAACKRKEDAAPGGAAAAAGPAAKSQPKKPRLVFTDLQRRTLQAIFKETKRPSKEMQITISQQLGLELSTVGNFFMNARRRSQDKWQDEADKKASST